MENDALAGLVDGSVSILRPISLSTPSVGTTRRKNDLYAFDPLHRIEAIPGYTFKSCSKFWHFSDTIVASRLPTRSQDSRTSHNPTPDFMSKDTRISYEESVGMPKKASINGQNLFRE
jgi:hypothetical protein